MMERKTVSDGSDRLEAVEVLEWVYSGNSKKNQQNVLGMKEREREVKNEV